MSEGILASNSSRVRSSRLPRPPWLGGVGPLVWRQAIQALRGSRGAISAGPDCGGGYGHSPGLCRTASSMDCSAFLPHIVIGVAAYVTFLFSAQAPLGFQGDYERMDLLKSLPIRPLAMACGQTLVVAMVLTLLQWLGFRRHGRLPARGRRRNARRRAVCPALQLDPLRHGELALPALSLPAGGNRLGRFFEDGPRHALHAGQVPRARRLRRRGSDPGGGRLSADLEYTGGLPCRLVGIASPRHWAFSSWSPGHFNATMSASGARNRVVEVNGHPPCES